MSPGALVRILQAALAAAEIEAARSSEEQGATPTVDSDRLIGPDDIGVSRVSWRAAIRSGELRATKIGREYLARRADVDAWLVQRRVAPDPPRSSGRDVGAEPENRLARAVARAADRRRRSA